MSTHITFELRKESCLVIKINGQEMPQHLKVKYHGVHLDRGYTWKLHMGPKLVEINPVKLALAEFRLKN